MRELEARLGIPGQRCAVVPTRFDRPDARVGRIERRLDPVQDA